MVSLSENRRTKWSTDAPAANPALPDTAPDVAEMFESCLGCKWTLHVLGQIRKGVVRPGALERTAPGLTTKVQNERLNKLVRFGVLEKMS